MSRADREPVGSHDSERGGRDRESSSHMNERLPLDAPRRLSLLRLSGEIAKHLGQIGLITVEGEIHDPRTRGRTYFTLKDRTAQISVVLPNTRARFARIVAGERVAVTGRLTFFHDYGALRFEAVDVAPVGEGAIAAMIAQARERLRAEGLLDRPRRRLPLLPAVVGVVCGSEAAVRRDIESVVAARFPGYPLRFVETAVQGGAAAVGIVDALRRLDDDPDVAAIILARGGGDASAMLPFSDEELCRAICAAATPIVSAIGHEDDRPLCDEVADHRAGTPSIAAHMVIPDRAALFGRIDMSLKAVDGAATRSLERGNARLSRVRWDDAMERRLRRAADSVANIDWQHALDRGFDAAALRLREIRWADPLPRRVELERLRLDGLRTKVEALSPIRVLERGYSVVRRTDGTVVRRRGDAPRGTVLRVMVSDGEFDAEVR